MGPSGEGKSTLGRIIAGLEDPQRVLSFLTESAFRNEKTEYATFRRRVQMMFQDPTDAFNPRKRIENSISEVLKLLDTPRTERIRRTKEMLKTAGLPEEVLSRYPAQLSGGQLQRLALGRILLLDPEYIVLDEPTSALDVSVQAQILHLLKRFRPSKK